jgi:hypothetical protein
LLPDAVLRDHYKAMFDARDPVEVVRVDAELRWH